MKRNPWHIAGLLTFALLTAPVGGAGPAFAGSINIPASHHVQPKTSGSLLINFVLDKSGSMGVRTKQTIDGFNGFLKDQQKQAEAAGGSTDFSLTLFDTTFVHRFTDVPIASVPPLDSRTYQPGGSTALYDAIGSSVRQVDAMDPKPAKVMFVILTDGMENSSVRWTQKEIFSLVTAKRQLGWQFVFLGVDEDAYAASAGLGMAKSATLTYDTAHSSVAFDGVARAVNQWRLASSNSSIGFGKALRREAVGRAPPPNVTPRLSPAVRHHIAAVSQAATVAAPVDRHSYAWVWMAVATVIAGFGLLATTLRMRAGRRRRIAG